MSTALKCPNPSCPYLFDPSRVPAGAVLTCPRCGMRFTLGPPVPAAAAPPQSQLPAAPAVSTGFEGMERNYAATEEGERRDLSAAGRASGYQTWIMMIAGIALLAGAVVAVVMKVTSKPDVVKGESGQQLRAHNLSFQPPGEPWTIDEDTRAKLGPPIILAFKRLEPEAYFAVGARDYDRREPRPSDLRANVDRVLERMFEEVTRTNLSDITFLGQPATVAFSFTAQIKGGGEAVAGLCYATSHKGIGYWTLSWAHEREAEGQAAAFEAIREKLKLDKSRENWNAKDLPVRTFGGHAAQYQLLDGEDVWKEPEPKERPASGEDPKGDLLLIARVKAPGQDVGAEATLVAILLDGAGDPLAQGRKYVEDRYAAQIKEADPKLAPKFLDRTGEPQGDPVSNTVETPTPVVRMQMTVQGASNFSKLVVVSAAKLGDRVVVVHASCAWSDRELFESKFAQIAGSLREPK